MVVAGIYLVRRQARARCDDHSTAEGGRRLTLPGKPGAPGLRDCMAVDRGRARNRVWCGLATTVPHQGWQPTTGKSNAVLAHLVRTWFGFARPARRERSQSAALLPRTVASPSDTPRMHRCRHTWNLLGVNREYRSKHTFCSSNWTEYAWGTDGEQMTAGTSQRRAPPSRVELRPGSGELQHACNAAAGRTTRRAWQTEVREMGQRLAPCRRRRELCAREVRALEHGPQPPSASTGELQYRFGAARQARYRVWAHYVLRSTPAF